MTTDTNAAYREMVKTEQNDIRAKLRAMLPAIEAIAKTSPYAFAEVKTFGIEPGAMGEAAEDTEPGIRIDLPMPGNHRLHVVGMMKHSRSFVLTIGSDTHFAFDSYSVNKDDKMRMIGQVFQVAATLATLLQTMTTAA